MPRPKNASNDNLLTPPGKKIMEQNIAKSVKFLEDWQPKDKCKGCNFSYNFCTNLVTGKAQRKCCSDCTHSVSIAS